MLAKNWTLPQDNESTPEEMRQKSTDYMLMKIRNTQTRLITTFKEDNKHQRHRGTNLGTKMTNVTHWLIVDWQIAL